MSISRLVARHNVLKSAPTMDATSPDSPLAGVQFEAMKRSLMPTQGVSGLTSEARAQADSEREQANTNGVTSALEVLSRYFPTEVFALYMFGLSGLKTVTGENCTIAATKAACETQYWVGLMAIAGLLVLFFVTVNWIAWNNTNRKQAAIDNASRKANGKDLVPFAPVTFPWWVLFAQLVAFLAWGLATPGNPVVTTGGEAVIAGFVALLSSHILSGLESILGEVKRKKVVEPEPEADPPS